MDVDLQSRTPQYGLARYYPETKIGLGNLPLLLLTLKMGGFPYFDRS